MCNGLFEALRTPQVRALSPATRLGCVGLWRLLDEGFYGEYFYLSDDEIRKAEGVELSLIQWNNLRNALVRAEVLERDMDGYIKLKPIYDPRPPHFNSSTDDPYDEPVPTLEEITEKTETKTQDV